MKTIRNYIRNIFTIIVLFVYSFVMLLQNIPFINIITNVKAEDAGNKINLVGVFVDGHIYNNIKGELSWYIDYIQKTNPNTKAILLPINVNSVSSLDLLKVIDNLYFYGEKEKTSFLKSIVLIGNIPLPVIDKGGFVYKSIYPYVDIVKPTFSYDKISGYFKYNGHAGDVELSHGIIKFKKINEYKNYFKKLKTYSSDPKSFVDRKFYLDNFVSQGVGFNHNMLKYYLNKLIFAENIVTKKITPLLLEYFNKQNNANYDNLTSGTGFIDKIGNKTFKEPKTGLISTMLGFDRPEVKAFSGIQNQYKQKVSTYISNINNIFAQTKNQKNNYWKVPTLSLESSLKNFFRDYIQLFGNTYGGDLTDNLKATGRYNWNNTVSSLNAIDIKDQISINYLKKVNNLLEQELDNKIDTEQYFMYYPLMTYYITDSDGDCNTKRYENFYFGRNAADVNFLKDLHIYRGTFGNFTGTDVLNQISSRGNKSSVSMMNNLFDTQTLSNRGYNVMLSKKDGDNYNKVCTQSHGACIDGGRYTDSENVKDWAKRIYGGYSSLDINANSIKKDPYNIIFNYSNYKQAWTPSYTTDLNGTLFNLGGTVSVKNYISTGNTDTIDALKYYSSVFKTKYYKYNISDKVCDHKFANGNNKTSGNYYDYVKDFGTICNGSCSVTVTGNRLKVNDYHFKFIDTRIKHTSPIKEVFTGFNMITKTRAIDSENYISFLGVGGHTIKLNYPDIFSISVYKNINKNLILKSPNEIDQSIKDYLKSIVKDYNDKLKNELDNKNKYYNMYKNAFSKISNTKYISHNYSLLSEDLFVNKIGNKKIAQLAEMLYYLNLGWKEKPTFSNLSGEVNYLYKNFNINEKISYVVHNYLDTETEKKVGGYNIANENINFPGKPSKGYEAGFIISKNLDTQNFNKPNLSNIQNNILLNSFLGQNKIPLNIEEQKKECGRPLGEGVILWEWPDAFMCRLKETLKKPFKIGTTSACVVGSSLNSESTGTTGDEEQYDNQEYNILKSVIDNGYTIRSDKSTYDYNDLTGNIQIINYANLSDYSDIVDKIYIKSDKLIGDKFFINGKSTWVDTKGILIPRDQWKIPFSFYNLKTGEGRYYSYKAGEKVLYVTFCTKNDVCYTKQVIFDKAAGKLKYVEIKPFSDVMVYGGENPFVIKGYDVTPNQGKYQNEINGSIWSYKLYLDPGIGNIRTLVGVKGDPSIDYNFSSSNQLMSIKSNTKPISGVNSFNIKLQIDNKWTKLIDSDIVKNASKNIKITNKKELKDTEVTVSNKNYHLPDDPNSLLTGDKDYQIYDKNKLLKIHIEPKVYGKILKTPLDIKDVNGNFIAGTFQKTTKNIVDPETGNPKVITYEKFVKQAKFLITKNTGIDVYLLPTYKTGPYKIDIKIPGINTYSITGTLKKFPIKDIYVVLDKYQAQPGEEVSGKFYGVDKFGNIQDDVKNIHIIHSSGLTVHKTDGNNITISGNKSGFIKFKVNGGNVNIVNFEINKTFIPLDGKISVMYLTLFGYDWGKYAEKIMLNSSKNLAITTTLYNPTNLKKYDYIIKENLKANKQAELLLNGNKTILDFGVLKVNSTGSVFHTPIQKADNIESINSNGIFYVKEQTDDIIKNNYITDGVLYINNYPVINFSNNTQNSNIKILSSLNNGKSVYNVFFNKHKVGSLLFNTNVLNLHKLSVDKALPTKIIPGSASSNGLKALGIIISDKKYQGIASSEKIDVVGDKGLGFRSNYRNITDFAAGMNVGNASKSFQNEFMINYGDPFVKRISSQEVIHQVSMSTTYGYRIHSSIAGGIQKVIPIDFNNDGLKDIAILYKNGSIRLLKNYKGAGNFQDLGNLMILGKSVKNMFVGDYDGDGYNDIFIKFVDGTIRVYKNNYGEFDADPYPVCLDVVGADGMHFNTNQIFFKDMNNDKKTDIVVNDLASNIKVFFGPTYVSNSIYKCSGIHLQQKLVKSYSYKVDANKKFMDDGYIYRQGFTDNSTLKQSEIRTDFKTHSLGTNGDDNINPDNYLSKVGSNGVDHFSTQDIPKVLGPTYVDITGDTIAFKKATFLTGSDPVDVYKTMEDLNGGALLPGDKVKITVYVNNKENKKITYLESLKGPFAVISKDDKPILVFHKISSSKVRIPLNYSNFLFQVDNYSQSFSISYEAYFQGLSSIKIKVDDFTKNNYGDIKVFLKNGCIKGYDYFKGVLGNPMNFNYEYVDLAKKLKDKVSSLKGHNDVNQLVKDIKDVDSGNGDPQSILNKFNLGGSDDVWGSNKFLKLMGSATTLDINIGPNLANIKSKVNKILNGLCRGIGFGKSDCGGTPIPCNFAFLAPGIINACGCPLGIDPGTPIFWFPGTKWVNCSHGPTPIPVPYHGSPQGTPVGGSAPTGCGPSVFPSQFRLYISPTLTAGVGVAACFGSYTAGMNALPAPAGAIAGNCIVTAGTLPGVSCKKDADDDLNDWMDDLDNGVCSLLPTKTGMYPFSSAIIPEGLSFQDSNISPSVGDMSKGNGLVKFQMQAHKINSLQDAKVLMEGGVPFSLNIETGTFKGLINCIIKKWFNKQIEFLINQLTQMTIYVTYPDMTGFLDGFKEKDWSHFDYDGVNFSNILNDFSIGKKGNTSNSGIQNKISKYLPSKKGLTTVGNQLSNPFNAVKDYFNDVPLINVKLKTLIIKVPWIGKDEIEKQIAYLTNWIEKQKGVLEKWGDLVDGFNGSCEGDKGCLQSYSSILKVKKFMHSVQKNIEILKEYRDFPLKLYKYIHFIDFYLAQISCIINKYIDMIVGWLNRNSKIFEKWVDTIITLINVIKTWQLLIDVSLDWKTTCGKCRMDAGDLYDCTLSGLCINLPILPIPPFKIPDIFIDFSHINLGVDIVLPKIKIYPVPIGMFTLPNLPYPSVSIELPPLPILPSPPVLKDLPSLPPVPTIELPNLPPPPLIPKLMPSIKVMLKVFKIVGYFRCIIKNGVGLVAERNVKTRIEQLTVRKNRIFPFDFLNIDFPLLPWAGFDIKIDAYLKYRLELSQVYDSVKHIADSINKKTGQSIGKMQELNLKLQNNIDKYKMDPNSFHFKFDKNSFDKQGFVFPKKQKKFVNIDFNKLIVNDKPIDIKIAKGILFDEISYLLSQKNEDYMNSIPNTAYQRAEIIQKDTIHKAKVLANIKGVYDIHNKFTKLLQENKSKDNEILKVLKDMEKGKKVNLNSNIFYQTGNNLVDYYDNKEKHIIYKINLFKIDKKSQSIIDHSEAPRMSYLKMYRKALTKFTEKVAKYKDGKPKKHYAYKELEDTAKQSLNVINNTLGKKITYAPPVNNITSNNSSVNIIADPSQYIRGLYMRGNNDVYYNVLNNKKKAQKVRKKKTYVLEDINNDGKKDMIWYDVNSIYIKYSNDKPQDNGIIITKKYIYGSVINDFSKIVDNNGFVNINGSIFKIWDNKIPVNDLSLNYSNAKELQLGWTNDTTVNSYTIFYSARIDVLDDIETKYNYASSFRYAGRNYKKYAIILYDKKLGKINNMKASKINLPGVYKKTFIPIDFNNKDKLTAILDKSNLELDDKWKYFRVYKSSLHLELNKLDLLSTYSNQEVGAEQVIGDETNPSLTTVLKRTNLKSNIIGTGNKLQGFVNTAYTIEGKWTDNIGVKGKWILDDNYVFIKTGDIIQILGFQKPTKKVYYFVAEDYNGNIEKSKVILNIGIPDIKIYDINANIGKVFSSVSSDMDNTAIKFGIQTKKGIKIIKNINGNTLFTGGILDKHFIGQIFDNTKQIILYGNDQSKIGSLNLINGNIKLDKSSYYILGDVSFGKLIYHVYNKNKKNIFSIYLPPNKQIQEPIMHKTNIFDIKKINNSKIGIFDGGYCIYDKITDMCGVYITKEGIVYVDKNYRNNFIVDYNINTLGTISSTFYNINVPNKTLLTENKKIFTIYYKTKDMSK